MIFHLVFVCWRSTALLLRIKKNMRGKKKDFLFVALTGLLPSVDPFRYALDLLSKREHPLPHRSWQKAAIPTGFLPGDESGVHTNNSHMEKLVCFQEHLGENVTQESSCQGTQGEAIKWQRTVLNERKLQLPLLREIKTNEKSSMQALVWRETTAWAGCIFVHGCVREDNRPLLHKSTKAFWCSDGDGHFAVHHR